MKALIVVDIQNDFLPGGALGVKEGYQIIPIVNDLIGQFELIVATQDWHPSEHGSFASNHTNKSPGDKIILHGLNQILWPDHCVQHSSGSEFGKDLEITRFNKVFQKGTNVHIDSYSGFFDNGKKKATGLDNFLKEHGIHEVFIVGLATDYCVKFTALDAAELGYDTYVIADATKAVNLQKGDFERAIEELRSNGIHVIQSSEI